jgi:hypothetical protein
MRSPGRRLTTFLCAGSLFAASCSAPASRPGGSPDAATDAVHDASSDSDAITDGETGCLCIDGSYGTDAAALACFCAEHPCTQSWLTALAKAKSGCPSGTYVGVGGWSPGCTGPRVISSGVAGLEKRSAHYDRETGELIGASFSTDTWICGGTSAKAGDTSPVTCGDFCMLCADEDAGAFPMCPAGDAGP